MQNATPDLVDVRGPRLAAWVTSAVLVVATGLALAAALLTAAVGLLPRPQFHLIVRRVLPARTA